MGKIDFVVFDLDGTLLDTRSSIINASIHTMKAYGMPVPEQSILESLIGPPIQEIYKNLFNLTNDDAMNMANYFREIYKTDYYLFKAEPYAEIFDLQKKLLDKGIKVGIATYKREDYAIRLLKEKGFDNYTDYMYGSDFEGKLKKSDIILKCLQNMGCIDYTKSVYVGDSKSDGIGAVDVGMNFIAVTYGFGFKSDHDAKIFNPIGVANNCSEILDIVSHYEN